MDFFAFLLRPLLLVLVRFKLLRSIVSLLVLLPLALDQENRDFFSRYFIINLSLFGFIRKRIRCFEGERFSNEFGEFSSIHDANWLIFQKVNMFCYPLKHTPQKLRSFFLRSPVKIDAVR